MKLSTQTQAIPMRETSNLQAALGPADALHSFVDSCNTLDAAFFDSARHTLSALLTDASLLDRISPLDTRQCSRTLLARDPMNRFGIWALCWPPGSETPIHNHHCACAFGVYRGRVEEILYACEPRADSAAERQRFVRERGYIGGAAHGSQVIHRMRNPDDAAAVSIHLYAYHPDRHENSIERSFVESGSSGRAVQTGECKPLTANR